MIQTSELSGPKMEPLQDERGGSKHVCARWEMAHSVLTEDFCTAKHSAVVTHHANTFFFLRCRDTWRSLFS